MAWDLVRRGLSARIHTMPQHLMVLCVLTYGPMAAMSVGRQLEGSGGPMLKERLSHTRDALVGVNTLHRDRPISPGR